MTPTRSRPRSRPRCESRTSRRWSAAAPRSVSVRPARPARNPRTARRWARTRSPRRARALNWPHAPFEIPQEIRDALARAATPAWCASTSGASCSTAMPRYPELPTNSCAAPATSCPTTSPTAADAMSRNCRPTARSSPRARPRRWRSRRSRRCCRNSSAARPTSPIPGRPARALVGGDFYDVFEVDDGWAVVIGDVCGTGPAAAPLTGLVRHTIRASAWHDAPHDEVLRQVNTAILRSGRATFCTSLFATMTRSRTASRSRWRRVVIRSRSSSARAARPSRRHPGTLLGVYADPSTFTASVLLRARRHDLLYTDGITDVAPPHDLGTDASRKSCASSSGRSRSAAEVIDLSVGSSRRSFRSRSATTTSRCSW